MYRQDHPDLQVQVIPAARRSLRVAVVTETYPPEINGVARTVARMVEGLHERDHEIQVIRPRQTQSEGATPARFEEILVRGLPIPRYPQLRMGLPSRRALVKLWSARRPDVVHIATEGPLGWSALSAAKHLRLPVSSDFRTNFHAYTQHYGMGWLRRPMAAYLRKFHNKADCTMVPTEGLRRQLQAEGFARLEVVARGVDTELFQPQRRCPDLRASWGAGPETLVMACVGRLAPEKNLGLLIEAYRAVAAQRPDARLLLVGDGPQRAELQAACPEAVFAGQRGGDDLARHYASADLFVFPSLTETFGNVTVEALASGLPVLAYDDAAASQLLRPGVNGLLVAPGDVAAFVDAACALAGNAQWRRSMAPQARLTALAQGWAPVIDRFEAILSRVAMLA